MTIYNPSIYYGQIPLKKIYKDNELLWQRFTPVDPPVLIDETKISITILNGSLEPTEVLFASTDHSEVSNALKKWTWYTRLGLYFGSQIEPVALTANLYSSFSTVLACHVSDAITDMGDSFMSGCPLLKKVNFPRSINAIKPGVYAASSWNYGNIEDIGGPIPGNIKTIYGGCLQYSMIRELAFEDGIETLMDGCFANCANIRGTVEIPSSILEIQQQAFYNCTNINKIVVHKSADQVVGSSYAPWGARFATVVWDP